MIRNRILAVLMMGAAATPALAQDSVSRTGCLPGDAVNAYNSAEQCDDYIVDMDDFFSSWGNRFAIAPIVKSSNTSTAFTGSLTSATGISRLQRLDTNFYHSTYSLWTDVGFGVHNNPAINTPGTPVSTECLTGNQFGAAFGEFSTTDAGRSYSGIIGAIVNYDPANPMRLYVSRVNAAVNGCNGAGNTGAFGFGSVDEDGNVMFRADSNGFGGTFTTCDGDPEADLTPIAGPNLSNIYGVSMTDRSCGQLNVISGGYLAAGGEMFDLGATDWLVRSSARAHNTPGILPASMNLGTPMYIGSNFGVAGDLSGDYVRGTTFPTTTSDSTHLAATNNDHRGNISYYAGNCAELDGVIMPSVLGTAAIIGKNTVSGESRSMNLWGLDAAGDVSGTLDLTPPAVIADPIPDPPPAGGGSATNDPGTNLIDHYHSQVAFNGGNGQIAIGKDQAGRLLAAVVVNQGTDAGTQWPAHFIAVARLNCATGAVEWTMAAYNNLFTSGVSGASKAILNSTGDVIGRLALLSQVTGGAPPGPSFSAPMIDSVGNIYFLSACEFFNFDEAGVYVDSDFGTALIRAVYDPAAFGYRLERLIRTGFVFEGKNSNRNYQVRFLAIADSNSVSSGTAWSQNISQTAFLGADPSGYDTEDPRTLGGLVLGATIVYDWDDDGFFNDCGAPVFPDTTAETTEEHNVLLYIAPAAAVVEATTGACCNDNACTDTAPDACYCNVNVLQDGAHGFGTCGMNPGGCCFGDADGNGTVNAGDRGFISANIGQSADDLLCLFDMDGNGTINAGDRGFVSANIGICAPLQNYQNGSGLNQAGDGPDPRFPGVTFMGVGTCCATTACP